MRLETLEGEEKRERENNVAIKIALVLSLVDLYEHLPHWTRSSFISVPFICA